MAHRVDPARRPTLEDVAARAGVSRALVSIVLRDVPGASDATRERVRLVADELGYRPDSHARSLAGRRSRLIGVALSLRNPFHADVADGVYLAAQRHGLQVVLGAVGRARGSRAAVDALLADRCAAILVLGTVLRRAALAELAADQPVVVVGQRSNAAGVDAVRVDDERGVALAVRHLVELGHRTIVHVDGGRAPGAAARRAGYRTAMARFGLAAQARVLSAGEREEDGAAAARVLAADPPDAVITYNDRSAVGVLDVFARSGIDVPGQVSIVGYDDSHVARLPYLRLTTIGQDPDRLAALAVARVVERLAGETVAQPDLVLAPHLVVRGTTAPR